jgi:hypothetical protein
MAITFYKKKIIYREDNQPYLIRYTLFTCKYFSIKIHHILLSDYDCLHCHPWNFISILLWGSYIEHSEKTAWSHYFTYVPREELMVAKRYGVGNILYRPADWKHRLEINKPVWSFVITFKKVRMWGFYTPQGFVPWYKYFGTNNGRCE